MVGIFFFFLILANHRFSTRMNAMLYKPRPLGSWAKRQLKIAHEQVPLHVHATTNCNRILNPTQSISYHVRISGGNTFF